jgi:GNAT superfamily N-acetyltransferase
MVTIRPATLEDLARVLEMCWEFLAQTRFGLFVQPSTSTLTKLILFVMTNGIILLAESDGEVVGMLAVAALEHPIDGRRFGDEIAWWVEPEHRKGRAGYRLLCAAEDWARQEGLKALKMVAPYGTDIGTFYERRGYVAVETAYHKTLKE